MPILAYFKFNISCDYPDNNGNTALDLAREIGNVEIIQLLTEAGAKERFYS
ncbi:MAG: ankyrin repeat domain-containing protein [Cyanobacteria bacterium J06621_8]